MKILWLCLVWPEKTSSAVGVRTHQLISACIQAGHEVIASSGCQTNSFETALNQDGVRTFRFEPNDSRFDDFVLKEQPHLVVFDRFITEEQFSWRVRQVLPSAIRVLDTIDLHFLRKAREARLSSGLGPPELLSEDFHSEDALRELSSIYRSDLSLIVSSAEDKLLRDRLSVPRDLLLLCRLTYPLPSHRVPSFAERSHFVIIGNFNHPPNADCVQFTREYLWPALRHRLASAGVADAEMHLYGAYPSAQISRLDNAGTRFRVKGWTADAVSTLAKYRVNLAPLRFGAGIKGKVADGWVAGTPCVGTSIASEGMHDALPFGGAVANEVSEFVESAARLYTDEAAWCTAQEYAVRILAEFYSDASTTRVFLSEIEDLAATIAERRSRNTVGDLLWYQKHRSTEYFSRWIEAKNKSPR